MGVALLRFVFVWQRFPPLATVIYCQQPERRVRASLKDRAAIGDSQCYWNFKKIGRLSHTCWFEIDAEIAQQRVVMGRWRRRQGRVLNSDEGVCDDGVWRRHQADMAARGRVIFQHAAIGACDGLRYTRWGRGGRSRHRRC